MAKTTLLFSEEDLEYIFTHFLDLAGGRPFLAGPLPHGIVFQDPEPGATEAPTGLASATALVPSASDASSDIEAVLSAGTTHAAQQTAADMAVFIAVTSNDPAYGSGSQWDMLGDMTPAVNVYGSQAGEAWAADALGSMKNVIGIVDTGIDYRHADLYLNIWLNQNEIPATLRAALKDTDGDGLITFRDLNSILNAESVADLNGNARIDAGDLLKDARWANGLDEDGNGYRDDLVGWDFVNNDNDPFDDNGHGTHVSGTIGAIGGNGTGIAGENWMVQMAGLKFLSASGSGSLSAAVQALDYFTKMAAATPGENFVATNNSWSGGGYTQSLQDCIVRAAKQDILFVAAAGNGGADGIGDNNDTVANYPSNYSTAAGAGYDAVIAVASLTSTGTLSSFSNYGKSTVDLAAPGSGIFSTLPNDSYGTYSGTSMAAPHVTGAAAVYAALHPDALAAEIKAAVLGTALSTASAANTATGGRLDISGLLNWTPPAAPSEPTYVYGTAGSDTVTGTAYADIVSGLANGGTSLGTGTVDRLYGLGGNDVFVLGDARGAFYNDGKANNAGKGDYGLVMDFQAGDKIQLSSSFANYFLVQTTVNSISGVGIYADTNANIAYNSTDEMIGLVANLKSLAASDFLFI